MIDLDSNRPAPANHTRVIHAATTQDGRYRMEIRTVAVGETDPEFGDHSVWVDGFFWLRCAGALSAACMLIQEGAPVPADLARRIPQYALNTMETRGFRLITVE